MHKIFSPIALSWEGHKNELPQVTGIKNLQVQVVDINVHIQSCKFQVIRWTTVSLARWQSLEKKTWFEVRSLNVTSGHDLFMYLNKKVPKPVS